MIGRIVYIPPKIYPHRNIHRSGGILSPSSSPPCQKKSGHNNCNVTDENGGNHHGHYTYDSKYFGFHFVRDDIRNSTPTEDVTLTKSIVRLLVVPEALIRRACDAVRFCIPVRINTIVSKLSQLPSSSVVSLNEERKKGYLPTATVATTLMGSPRIPITVLLLELRCENLALELLSSLPSTSLRNDRGYVYNLSQLRSEVACFRRGKGNDEAGGIRNIKIINNDKLFCGEIMVTVDAVSPPIVVEESRERGDKNKGKSDFGVPFALVEIYDCNDNDKCTLERDMKRSPVLEDSRSPAVSTLVLLGNNALSCLPGIIPGNKIILRNVAIKRWHVPNSLRGTVSGIKRKKNCAKDTKKRKQSEIVPETDRYQPRHQKYDHSAPRRLWYRVPTHVLLVENPSSVVWVDDNPFEKVNVKSVDNKNMHCKDSGSSHKNNGNNSATQNNSNVNESDSFGLLPSSSLPSLSLPSSMSSGTSSKIKSLPSTSYPLTSVQGLVLSVIRDNNNDDDHTFCSISVVHLETFEDLKNGEVGRSTATLYLRYHPLPPAVCVSIRAGAFISAINVHCVPKGGPFRSRAYGACLRSVVTIVRCSDTAFVTTSNFNNHDDNKYVEHNCKDLRNESDERTMKYVSSLSRNKQHPRFLNDIRETYDEMEWIATARERWGNCDTDVCDVVDRDKYKNSNTNKYNNQMKENTNPSPERILFALRSYILRNTPTSAMSRHRYQRKVRRDAYAEFFDHANNVLLPDNAGKEDENMDTNMHQNKGNKDSSGKNKGSSCKPHSHSYHRWRRGCFVTAAGNGITPSLTDATIPALGPREVKMLGIRNLRQVLNQTIVDLAKVSPMKGKSYHNYQPMNFGWTGTVRVELQDNIDEITMMKNEKFFEGAASSALTTSQPLLFVGGNVAEMHEYPDGIKRVTSLSGKGIHIATSPVLNSVIGKEQCKKKMNLSDQFSNCNISVGDFVLVHADSIFASCLCLGPSQVIDDICQDKDNDNLKEIMSCARNGLGDSSCLLQVGGYCFIISVHLRYHDGKIIKIKSCRKNHIGEQMICTSIQKATRKDDNNLTLHDAKKRIMTVSQFLLSSDTVKKLSADDKEKSLMEWKEYHHHQLVVGRLVRQCYIRKEAKNSRYDGCVLTLSHVPTSISSNIENDDDPTSPNTQDPFPRSSQLVEVCLTFTLQDNRPDYNITDDSISAIARAWGFASGDGCIAPLLSGGWDEDGIFGKCPPVVLVVFPSKVGARRSGRLGGSWRFECGAEEVTTICFPAEENFANSLLNRECSTHKTITFDSLGEKEKKSGILECHSILSRFEINGTNVNTEGMINNRAISFVHRHQKSVLASFNNLGGIPTCSLGFLHELTSCVLLSKMLREGKYVSPSQSSLVWRINQAQLLHLTYCRARIECTNCFGFLIRNKEVPEQNINEKLQNNEPQTFWHIPLPINSSNKDKKLRILKAPMAEKVDLDSDPSNNFSRTLCCALNCGLQHARVKWECSGVLDDGTGQAKIYADREGAVKLLGKGLDIETVERGAWENEEGIVFQKCVPPGSCLKDIVDRTRRARWIDASPSSLCGIKSLSIQARAEYQLQRYCRNSQIIQEKMTFLCRYKALPEYVNNLNQTRFDLISSRDLNGKGLTEETLTYTLPPIRLGLVDCYVIRKRKITDSGWDIVRSLKI